ncbi:MAG: hypothetical protein H0X62_05235 [Bacteroidetes bacterium]|nr:hypothetical protein [Bacteroidota bacterium]
METTQNKPSEKLISQLKNLENGNNAEVLTAIKIIRDEGNEAAIPFLVKTLVKNPDQDIKNEISYLLFDLKNEKALPPLILAIHNPENKEYRRLLISACWESGLNCSPYLKIFVHMAVASDYLETIECLTVIENMIGPFNPGDLDESIIIARDAADEDEARFDLLNSIWEVLVDLKAESE